MLSCDIYYLQKTYLNKFQFRLRNKLFRADEFLSENLFGEPPGDQIATNRSPFSSSSSSSSSPSSSSSSSSSDGSFIEKLSKSRRGIRWCHTYADTVSGDVSPDEEGDVDAVELLPISELVGKSTLQLILDRELCVMPKVEGRDESADADEFESHRRSRRLLTSLEMRRQLDSAGEASHACEPFALHLMLDDTPSPWKRRVTFNDDDDETYFQTDINCSRLKKKRFLLVMKCDLSAEILTSSRTEFTLKLYIR